jgi:hypothetical protein
MKNGTKGLFTAIRARNWMRLVGPTAGACVLTVLLATSVGADTTPTIYYACVNMKSGSIYMVNAGDTCKKGYTPMSWNQVGPQGPQGPAGPQGPQGPAGPSQTLQVQRVDSANTLIPPGGFGAAVAECPAGTFLTGGGFDFVPAGETDQLVVGTSFPLENVWHVEALAPIANADTISLTAFAVCASLA